MDRERALKTFNGLIDIMERLRAECPWDREQTNESLRSLTIEETYELSDAILNRDPKNISKELGDLMLHLLFYSKIGEERGEFDLITVMEQLSEKLIFRHPHIFSDRVAESSEEVEKNWEELKGRERGGNSSLLSGVPISLPSLIKAYRIQDKARAVGFDWEKREQVWEKVKEEIEEFEQEQKGESERREEEFGDLLFSLVNAARLYQIDPDHALELTNKKFIRRFNYLEKRVRESGRNINRLSLEEMEQLWSEAKTEENE